MDCHSNHSVFLRANGSLACWCDAGSKLTLKAYDPTVNYSKDVVFGPVFSGLRGKLQKGEMPFPDYCRDCMVLASGACFNRQWEEKKEIHIFQVEASIACILECPGCMTLAARKKNHGRPWHLEVEIFEKYLSDFKNDGVSIRTIDFQGHGEPLLNRNVWKMAGLAKSYFPQANITMCTVAHGKYDRSQIHSGIDEVMFAIDGIDQKSFEENRIRGNFDKAYTFMKSFCQGVINEGREIKTIWKYILFDCNNSPEQLIRAQEMAAEAGVQEILFVNTQLGPKSSKVFSLDEIPKVDNGVKVSISGYLNNFGDTLHGIDKARFALLQNDPDAAGSHLLYAANMIRRRFEGSEQGDVLPKDYQALIYEILNLGEHDLLTPEIRSKIRANFHLIAGKLDIGALSAKDLIIQWKSEEILRLVGLVYGTDKRRIFTIVSEKMEYGFNTLGSKLALQTLLAKNRIIKRKSQRVLQLAQRLNQQPGPGVSVI
ncbi:4Fe-4S cluster-binding domain-containing protein (plasmid) [Aliisedimentitalea scapharcae]|uniref:4Fe-4S cluster-binding domain-containing protein n=1 Tax=Aliisedimentitalea scapharcae TaxID=1524259 RepID=A0ABZ2Y0R0_9RHOB